MRISPLLTILILSFALLPQASHALSVAPAIINIDGEPKDEVVHTITLTNDASGSAKANIYTFVWDLDTYSGVRSLPENNALQLGESLAQWIAIPRGPIEIMPGAQAEVPMTIKINLRANEGDYHAMVSFAAGASRTEAMQRVRSGQGIDILVNADVTQTIHEVLQLNRFLPERSIALGASTILALELENIGDQILTPKGSIHVTDKRGREVAVLDVNTDSTSLNPNERKEFSIPLNVNNLGRYKAFLELQYGSSRASVTDTAFVTFVPMRIAFSVTLLIVAFLIWRWFIRREDDEYYDDVYDEDDSAYEHEDIHEYEEVQSTPPRVG